MSKIDLVEENEALRTNIRELQSQITILQKQFEEKSLNKRFDQPTIGVLQALTILRSALFRIIAKVVWRDT